MYSMGNLRRFDSDPETALASAPALARETLRPWRRSHSCWAAGVVLAFAFLAASVDSYLWERQLERAQLIDETHRAQRHNTHLQREVEELRLRLQVVQAQPHTCVDKVRRPERLEMPFAPVFEIEATRTRANRPLRPTPALPR